MAMKIHLMLFIIFLLYTLVQLIVASSTPVDVTFKASNTDDNTVPDDVNVTITSHDDVNTTLHLHRVPDHDSNVPVYTLNVGQNGHIESVKEKLSEKSDTGFYEDTKSNSVVQLTKLRNNIDDTLEMIMEGDIVIGKERFILKPTKTPNISPKVSQLLADSRTSLSSQFSRISYTLKNITEQILNFKVPLDFKDTPPSIKERLKELSKHVRPGKLRKHFDIHLDKLKRFQRNLNRKVSDTFKTLRTSFNNGKGADSFKELHNDLNNGKMADSFKELRNDLNNGTLVDSLKSLRNGLKNDTVADSFKRAHKTFGKVSDSLKGLFGHFRQRREASPYLLDVVAVIDYGLFKQFKDQTNSRLEALEKVREHIALLFTGVDLRYQRIKGLPMKISLSRVYIAETPLASNFTENHRLENNTNGVNSTQVLESFAMFAAGPEGEILLPYDHATLITGYDLSDVHGMAYLGTMCNFDDDSVSIVNDIGGYQEVVHTIAHEIGHSLSAQHDGEAGLNACNSSDLYIMTVDSVTNTEENDVLNSWTFSPCSISYFTNFISYLNEYSSGVECLTKTLKNVNVPDVNDQLPGQMKTTDEQCQTIYGPTSRLCRAYTNISEICVDMFCLDPGTGYCMSTLAASGTPCGDGKICLYGECVNDSRGVAVDETCPFGDSPLDGNDTCPDFIGDFNGNCYDDDNRQLCCATCNSIYRNIPNCEYGDLLSGCDKEYHCITEQDVIDCCGTCGVGITTTASGASTGRVTTQPTLMTTLMKTTQPSLTTAIMTTAQTLTTARKETTQKTFTTNAKETPEPNLTTTTTKPVLTTKKSEPVLTTPLKETTVSNDHMASTQVPGCMDVNDKPMNHLQCGNLKLTPHVCYNETVRELCCVSCQKLNTGNSGCQYGDKDPVVCKSTSNCDVTGDTCCQTCQGNNKGTTDVIHITTGDLGIGSAAFLTPSTVITVFNAALTLYFIVNGPPPAPPSEEKSTIKNGER